MYQNIYGDSRLNFTSTGLYVKLLAEQNVPSKLCFLCMATSTTDHDESPFKEYLHNLLFEIETYKVEEKWTTRDYATDKQQPYTANIHTRYSAQCTERRKMQHFMGLSAPRKCFCTRVTNWRWSFPPALSTNTNIWSSQLIIVSNRSISISNTRTPTKRSARLESLSLMAPPCPLPSLCRLIKSARTAWHSVISAYAPCHRRPRRLSWTFENSGCENCDFADV